MKQWLSYLPIVCKLDSIVQHVQQDLLQPLSIAHKKLWHVVSNVISHLHVDKRLLSKVASKSV